MSSIVYFAHGKESGPWGSKISRLAEISKEYSYAVESPDYTFSKNGDERTQHFLQNVYKDTYENVVLVGSSMGGYVATVAAQTIKPTALFLMAPALYMPNYFQKQTYSPQTAHISIVHGWHDDIVPVDNSIRFARKHHCALHVLDSDHRLISAIDQIAQLYRNFLDNIPSK
ncbi:YqiA/YcfP family alpha/beta fold hydrolase [Candidatus Uabimicrobium amorphum]|uniref:Alpha/beta hydrolase n=1 Tax=Uabimicrobium amorphum TaxID=2596890 RepID=A0A5S9IU45_UABAM|nr:YqiA/YcfP family alpha/beta fold hydrolase [Candidatus Uabimicrobium amorphum]BBM87610.1 alpha/beta hydrolase [Candidatus Uabimicrobium amorphum]